LEIIGAITLVTDNGLHVLVDTGSASETEVLLRGLADNQVALDDIDVVVVTHGLFYYSFVCKQCLTPKIKDILTNKIS
jgi:G:T-mismatch repair DNA endonuclease (very short patch repair protein)